MLSPGTLEPTARVGQVLEQAALEAQDLQQPSLLPRAPATRDPRSTRLGRGKSVDLRWALTPSSAAGSF